MITFILNSIIAIIALIALAGATYVFIKSVKIINRTKNNYE